MKFTATILLLFLKFGVIICMRSNIIITTQQKTDRLTSLLNMSYSLDYEADKNGFFSVLTQNLTLIWFKNQTSESISMVYSVKPHFIIEKCKFMFGKSKFGKKNSPKVFITFSINKILSAKFACEPNDQYFGKIYITNYFVKQFALLTHLPKNMSAMFLISKNASYISVGDCIQIFKRECENLQQKQTYLFVLIILGIILFISATICVLDIFENFESIFLMITSRRRAKVAPFMH